MKLESAGSAAPLARPTSKKQAAAPAPASRPSQAVKAQGWEAASRPSPHPSKAGVFSLPLSQFTKQLETSMTVAPS